MKILNNLIADYDNDISRLRHGNEITRSRKKVRINLEHRNKCKLKLVSGICTPLEYFGLISRSLKDIISLHDSSVICVSDDSEDDQQEEPFLQPENQNLCVICLTPQDATWLFIPCKHANRCTHCTNTIMETVKSCPTCRSQITEKISLL